MDKALADLIKISNVTGKDPTLVLGGGGNTSVKTADGKYMYIKASGTALKDMTEQRGWRRLRIDGVLSILTDKSMGKMDVMRRETEVVNRLLSACFDEIADGARPSVEAHLHALLDSHVIHLHPLVVAAYVSAKGGRARLERLLAKERMRWLWVPYADPGYMLAKRIAALVADYEAEHGKKPNVLFLEKHGIFVTANDAGAALRLVRKVISLCQSKLKAPRARTIRLASAESITEARLAIRKALFDATGRYLPVSYYPPSDTVAAFMAQRQAKQLLATPALNPDELVYANGSAIWVDKVKAEALARRLRSLVEAGQKTPAAFVI
jgi:rhamnose utilization protein RhaD (predicted bifunctional aldolase and dehydrogenase)